MGHAYPITHEEFAQWIKQREGLVSSNEMTNWKYILKRVRDTPCRTCGDIGATVLLNKEDSTVNVFLYCLKCYVNLIKKKEVSE